MIGADPSICQSFCDRSIATWNDLLNGWASGLNYGEETLTDNNLAAIDRVHFPRVQFVKFTRLQESVSTGADWEWWVAAPGRWVGLRVQAKKLGKRGRYEALNTPKGREQADLLISSSGQDQVWPFYCFYNAWRNANLRWRWRARNRGASRASGR